MHCTGSLTLLVYFTCFLRGLSERDIELLEKLNKEKIITKRYCRRNFDNFVFYHVDLYVQKDHHNFDSKDIKEVLFVEKCYSLSIEIGNEEQLNSFISLIKRNKHTFYSIKIKFKYEEDKKCKDIRDFVKYFESMLIDDNIDHVNVVYEFNEINRTLFYPNVLWNEIYDEELCIIRILRLTKVEDFIEKRFITNDFLNDLIKDYFCLYFNLLTNSKEEELIRKYIFNHKLLLIDIDSLTEEEILLSRVSEEENDCSKINYCNILFYFLKDSNILKNMVTRSLNNCESEDYFTFRTILNDLEVDFIDGYQILLSNTNKILTPCIKNINEYLIDDISKKIRKLKVKNDTKKFKRLLNYFYNYLKNNEKIDVDLLLRIIDESIVNDNIKRKNIKIYKKLNQYVSLICNNEPSKFFCERCSDWSFITFRFLAPYDIFEMLY